MLCEKVDKSSPYKLLSHPALDTRKIRTAQDLVFTEILARTLKNMLREQYRRVHQGSGGQIGDCSSLSESLYFEVTVNFLNLVFSRLFLFYLQVARIASFFMPYNLLSVL